MRIVHTCLRYPPATGGAETYIKEIVERTRKLRGVDDFTNSGDLARDAGIANASLAKQDEQRMSSRSQNFVESDTVRDVRVLTSKMRTHHPILELDPELLLDDPMYIQRLHHASTPIFAYPRLQALSYYIDHHQPDILESYGFWYQPADVTARYAKKHNIPFIFHPLYYKNENRQKLVWQLYKNTIGKKTFAVADVVVVISPFEQELIEKTNFPVKRFELIPPGVDVEKFDRPRLNPFLKRNLSGNTLLAVNRLAPGKGLDELVEVFADVVKEQPETHLVLIGEDFGERARLQAQTKKLQLQSRVHFWGKVDEETLIAAYQHASLFIHPSHYEAFGIVVAEALAAGTPVIARDTSAIPFVAPHEKTGLLFQTQKEFGKHILTLLQDQNLRKKLGQAGIKHVKENFTWDKSINKILQLYDELRK